MDAAMLATANCFTLVGLIIQYMRLQACVQLPYELVAEAAYYVHWYCKGWNVSHDIIPAYWWSYLYS